MIPPPIVSNPTKFPGVSSSRELLQRVQLQFNENFSQLT